MANFYKNAFYDPTSTARSTVYTCPSNARAIIQNIQITNESGSKITKASINDASTSTIFKLLMLVYQDQLFVILQKDLLY
jgi:ABC-type transport system involved in Fe-S cluster assembly fused permease/ATPase subunit